jgi:hypothetical protein
MMAHSAGMVEYLKRAFLYRWNLLLFFGGAAATALSPWPDALLPLLLAAEIAYLGGLVSRPKFRDTIDAQVHKEAQQSGTRQGAVAGGESLIEIVNSLSPPSRQRFEALRSWRSQPIGVLLGGFEHACLGPAALDFSTAIGVPTGAGSFSSLHQ